MDKIVMRPGFWSGRTIGAHPLEIKDYQKGTAR
jgi:hypothetical protein